MLFGHAYRKFVSQLWAFIAFRWVAIWLLVVACCARGQIGETAAFVIIAGDISVGILVKTVIGSLEDKHRRDWHDRLTNRLFYKLFWEQITSGGARSADVDGLFQQASKDAIADQQKASSDDKAQFGTFDTTWWHWFGGALSFIWQWVAAILYYGSAWVVGHGNL